MEEGEDGRNRRGEGICQSAQGCNRLTDEGVKKKRNKAERGEESKSITLMTGCSLLCSLEDDRHSDLPAVSVSSR